jgi:hypothetical protein
MKQPITQLEQITITKASKSYLIEIAKWTQFLSVIGFVFLFFLFVFALFSVPVFESITKTNVGIPDNLGFIVTVINIATCLLYFFPLYYLLQFSKKIKKALKTKK